MDELQKTKTESKKLTMESTSFSSSSCASTESNKNVENSFLDLSNFNKTSYTKQKSINNTNEVFSFFTNITNNQKDLSKKYEQLFALIKKHGKELKYLFAKNDEHCNLLTNTNKYAQKVKEHLSNAAYERAEQIERELYEDNNNIDIVTRLIIHILKTVEKYHSNYEECNIEINRLKRDFQNFLNKADYSNLERQLTIKNEELKREFTNNMNILKEQQDLKTKIQNNTSNYKKDIKTIYSKLIYFIYKFFMYHKHYKQKKIILYSWLYKVKIKKKSINTIINYIYKKELCLLMYSFKRLKNNSYETTLMERVLTLINNCNTNTCNVNDGKNRRNLQLYPNIASVRNIEDKLNYANLGSIYNNEKKKSVKNHFSSYNSSKLRKNENSFHCENYNNTIKSDETYNTYVSSFNPKVTEDVQLEETDILHPFSETYRESDIPLKKYMDTYINHINNKADKKNVDVLYQTIKKLNYKLNEIKNSLEIQKKINEELLKFVPKETRDSIYKKNKTNNINFTNEGDRNSTFFEEDKKNSVWETNKINSLLEEKRKHTMFDNYRKNSTHNMANRTLSEFMLNHQPLKKISIKDNSHVKSMLKRKDEESESKGKTKRKNEKYKRDTENEENTQRSSKYDNLYRKEEFLQENEKLMSRKFFENLEKINDDIKFPEGNTNGTSTNNYDSTPFYHDIRQFKDKENVYAKKGTCDRRNISRQRANSRINKLEQIDVEEKINKNNAVNKFNRQVENYSDRETIEEPDDNSNTSNINLCLRTGGGFRKLSEQDKNRFLQKMNYLHGNNLLGYETNLNIKIKTPALLKNIPCNYQKAFKKEKRHRSLSTFHNMY